MFQHVAFNLPNPLLINDDYLSGRSPDLTFPGQLSH
jgi:hypothetical protein